MYFFSLGNISNNQPINKQVALHAYHDDSKVAWNTEWKFKGLTQKARKEKIPQTIVIFRRFRGIRIKIFWLWNNHDGQTYFYFYK